MTNSPIFSEQIPLAAYWKSIGGETMLPGTNRATDRFARASYYINEATDIAGEQTKNFKPAELFKFLAPTE